MNSILQVAAGVLLLCGVCSAQSPQDSTIMTEPRRESTTMITTLQEMKSTVVEQQTAATPTPTQAPAGTRKRSIPDQRDVDRVLHDRDLYDKYNIPPWNGAFPIWMGFYVNNMAFDHLKGLLEINAYMRFLWRDWRLGKIFDGYNVSDSFRLRLFKDQIEHMWLPDVFIKNSDKVDKIDAFVPELYMTVDKYGWVWHVPRIVKTVYCPQLRQPLRKTQCSVAFESYGYGKSQIELLWLNKPIGMESTVQIDGQDLETFNHTGCSVNGSGAYPCVEASFTWQRHPPRRVFIIGIYVISTLLLIISWFGFWTPPGDRRVMMGLSIGVILVLLYLATALDRNYSYVEILTSVQAWLLFCVCMDLGMVFEYGFAHILIRIIPHTLKTICCECRFGIPEFHHKIFENEDDAKSICRSNDFEMGNIEKEGRSDSPPQKEMTTIMRAGYIIDLICGIIIFPGIFITFFAIFSGLYLPFV